MLVLFSQVGVCLYDSNFLHLLLHALKAKGLGDLQTYTGNG